MNSEMKVLVTGANGFLAANVVRELLSRDIEVRGMVRQHADMKSLEGLDFEIFHGNITNASDVDKAVSGCSVIIHAAADTSQRYSQASPLYRVNVEATRLLVEAAQRHKTDRFIFISTGNTIGFGSRENPGHEGNPIGSLFQKSGYAMSKLEAEKRIQEEVKKNNLNAVIMNPTFMIGPFDAKPSSGRIFKMMYPNKMVFIPRGGKNFTDVRAASTAICNAITMGKTGERYLLAGENLSYHEFLEIVRFGKKTIPVLIPDWVLIFLGVCGSFLRRLGIHSELSISNAKILVSDDYYTGRKAAEELKMPPTSVRVAVNDAIDWFQKDKML
jgi:dihydroflavonol-4-reductase